MLSEVQKITHTEGTKTAALVDNTHSMLMLDCLDKSGGLEEAFASRVRAVTDFYPFRNLLSSCYSALAEVTADLFDVGTVLHGKDRETSTARPSPAPQGRAHPKKFRTYAPPVRAVCVL